MFELKLGLKRTCDGVTRRDVLRVGTLSVLGLSLPRFFELQAHGSGARSDREVSCILVWLQGGISHIDSFDPKPEAPEEIRGEFGVIGTNVPGIRVCEHLPQLAQQQDQYSILRSLNPRNGSHGVADAYMLSGHPFNQSVVYPSYGAVVAKEQGDRNAMPPYVQLGANIDQRFGGGVAGFLGDQYNPFVLPGDASRSNFAVRDVVLPGGVDRGRFQRRMKVLHEVDTWQRRMEDDSGPTPLQAADTFYQKAYNLVTAPHAKKAFDIHSEEPRIRDRYGRNSLGQGCLLARRLIEGGVRFVTVTDGGWDTHQNNFTSMKTRLLPRLDAAISGLLHDLSARGRLDSTLVLVLSDFGRTPKVNPSAGRDHWSTAGIALLAGGGVRPGLAVGRTNALGEQPTEAPYYTEDVAATLYHCLGIPLDTTHQTPDGRPIQINYEGRVIQELV
ncbi:MAG: DUF1501 domain-containing protein [Isosphaeraceae bacterium]